MCIFKKSAKKVVIGYSNQQMLLCSCTNVDAIASGTFMNVRSFDLGKFNENQIIILNVKEHGIIALILYQNIQLNFWILRRETMF